MLDALPTKLSLLPLEPGVYVMKDAAGKVLYVGKAANLRARVRSYFQDFAHLHPRIRSMVEQVAEVEVIIAQSETEALILEFNLIQQHRPRYNVRFRDDKRYPYLRLGLKDPYPPLMVVRRPAQDGARYFGPHASTRSMWGMIRLLRRVFRLRFARKDPSRDCAGRPFSPFGQKRPRACLDYYIGLCLGPCAEGTCAEEEYAAAVKAAIDFLEGKHAALLGRMRREMEKASEELRFEAAARLRDSIAAVERATAEQRVVGEKREEADVIAAALEQDLACIAVFQVREGRLIGQSRFFLEGIAGLEESDVLAEFVKVHYLRMGFLPARILLAHDLKEKAAIAILLQEKKGGRVSLLAPQRGEKRKLVELAAENARHYLKEALSREGDKQRRAEEALVELQQALQLPNLPQRIECYDISNLFGRQAVGSMVVFERGLANKSAYRRFRIRSKEGEPDDFAMMREVLERRLQAGLKGSERFAQMPDLILVDGGKGQLNVALEALRQMGLSIPAVGLAKEFEHLFVEGRSEPIALSRHSRALHLLQALRDEAHRFAISYHRSLRRRDAVASILLSIPGIGAKREQALLSRFPSLEAIRQAGVEEIAAVPGMTRAVAEVLVTNLRAAAPDT